MILTAVMKLSPAVNGLAIPFRSIDQALARFCPPALFHNEGQPAMDLSKSGSSLRLRYSGRNFALCTGHQLVAHAQDAFTVTLFEPDGSRLGLTPNGVTRIRMEHAEHANLEDLFIAEYENERNGRDLRPLFLDLDIRSNLATVPSEAVQAIFAIGYPTAFGDLDFICNDEGEVTGMSGVFRWVKLYLDRAPEKLLDTENRIPMVQSERADQETIDPDGMSGSPVFFVYLTSAMDARIGIAGLVSHALDRRYMVYDAAILARILDGYIDGET